MDGGLHPYLEARSAAGCRKQTGYATIRALSCLKSRGYTLAPIEYLGLIAGLLTTFSTVPQIMRVYKLKSARDISFLFNTSILVGVVIWLAYGIIQGLISLIIWNAIGIILNVWLLVTKIKYGRQKPAV